MKNLKEFKELIERYESITLEEIEEVWGDNSCGESVAQELTGFSGVKTCTLCKSVRSNCSECVYKERGWCYKSVNKETYYAISDASTPTELLEAFRNRAKHMRTLI